MCVFSQGVRTFRYRSAPAKTARKHQANREQAELTMGREEKEEKSSKVT